MRYRILSAMFALAMVLGTMGLTTQSARAQGDAVAPNTQVAGGTLAVWEVVKTPNLTVQIWAGMLPASITTTGVADIAMNAWVNYPDVSAAQAGGCQLAASRKSAAFFANFSIQFQDQPFNGQCGQAPSASAAGPPPPPSSGTILNPPTDGMILSPCNADFSVTPGTWLPAGQAHNRREFTWNLSGGPVDVRVYSSPGENIPIYAGSNYPGGQHPLSERAVWRNNCDGSDWSTRVSEACQEAGNLMGGSLGFTPRTVYLNDVKYTGTCPGAKTLPVGQVRPVIAVPVGTTLPAGRAVIVRAVGSDGAVFIYVERSLKTPLYVSDVFGFAVWSSVDGQPWPSMDIDGCGEAVEVIKGGLSPFRWTTVFLDGVRMPTPTCPDP